MFQSLKHLIKSFHTSSYIYKSLLKHVSILSSTKESLDRHSLMSTPLDRSMVESIEDVYENGVKVTLKPVGDMTYVELCENAFLMLQDSFKNKDKIILNIPYKTRIDDLGVFETGLFDVNWSCFQIECDSTVSFYMHTPDKRFMVNNDAEDKPIENKDVFGMNIHANNIYIVFAGNADVNLYGCLFEAKDELSIVYQGAHYHINDLSYISCDTLSLVGSSENPIDTLFRLNTNFVKYDDKFFKRRSAYSPLVEEDEDFSEFHVKYRRVEEENGTGEYDINSTSECALWCKNFAEMHGYSDPRVFYEELRIAGFRRWEDYNDEWQYVKMKTRGIDIFSSVWYC